MNNYFSSCDLYNGLTKQKINCSNTVRPKHKGSQMTSEARYWNWNGVTWQRQFGRTKVMCTCWHTFIIH